MTNARRTSFLLLAMAGLWATAACTSEPEIPKATGSSEMGLSLSILRTFAAPKNKMATEDMTQKINATVTALLGLSGISADPVQSREHRRKLRERFAGAIARTEKRRMASGAPGGLAQIAHRGIGFQPAQRAIPLDQLRAGQLEQRRD